MTSALTAAASLQVSLIAAVSPCCGGWLLVSPGFTAGNDELVVVSASCYVVVALGHHKQDSSKVVASMVNVA